MSEFKYIDRLKIGDFIADISDGVIEFWQQKQCIFLNEVEWATALQDWLSKTTGYYPEKKEEKPNS